MTIEINTYKLRLLKHGWNDSQVDSMSLKDMKAACYLFDVPEHSSILDYRRLSLNINSSYSYIYKSQS